MNDTSKIERTIVQNKDNGSLLPYTVDGCIFGCVEQVNGPGAEEITAYTPTRHELIQLVRFWFREILAIQWKLFSFGQSGSSEWRIGRFAMRRIERAKGLIGTEAVDQAIKVVLNKSKANVHDVRLWDIFVGSDDERSGNPKEDPEDHKHDGLANDPPDRTDIETEKRTIVQNSDNDYLLPSLTRRYVFPYLEEVNGAGAREITGYTPTRHELIQLVEFWHRELLDIQWSSFFFGKTRSYQAQLRAFAKRRVGRAEALIGKEAVDQAVQEVRRGFKSDLEDVRLWDIFENGDWEQREAVQDEWIRKQFEQDATDALERLERLEKKSPGDFIAMVLCSDATDKCRAALISPTDSELNAVLQASGQFEVVTDRSRFRALMLDQHFQHMGFLSAALYNGKWMFKSEDSKPGTIGWHFLERATDQIKGVLHAGMGKGSQPA